MPESGGQEKAGVFGGKWNSLERRTRGVLGSKVEFVVGGCSLEEFWR